MVTNFWTNDFPENQMTKMCNFMSILTAFLYNRVVACQIYYYKPAATA